MDEIFKYKYDDLFNPVIKALNLLGGTGTVSEIEERVIKILKLSENEISDIHRNKTTKLNYRLAWARNYLKRYGLIKNPSRSVWALTPEGLKTNTVNQEEVKKFVKKIKSDNNSRENKKSIKSDKEVDGKSWKEEVLEIFQSLPPKKFERLCEIILKELGFINVNIINENIKGSNEVKGVVKIDNDVYADLKRIAESFKSTPNAFIRKLLRDHKKNNTVRKKPKNRTSQSVCEQWLIYILWKGFNGSGTKKKVTKATVEAMQRKNILKDDDFKKLSTGEIRVENTIAWARNSLKEKGCISLKSRRGIWELTEKGRKSAEKSGHSMENKILLKKNGRQKVVKIK